MSKCFKIHLWRWKFVFTIILESCFAYKFALVLLAEVFSLEFFAYINALNTVKWDRFVPLGGRVELFHLSLIHLSFSSTTARWSVITGFNPAHKGKDLAVSGCPFFLRQLKTNRCVQASLLFVEANQEGPFDAALVAKDQRLRQPSLGAQSAAAPFVFLPLRNWPLSAISAARSVTDKFFGGERSVYLFVGHNFVCSFAV